MAPPASGNGVVGWGDIPFLLSRAVHALMRCLAGLTGCLAASQCLVPSWESQPFPTLPAARILVCATLTWDPSLFCGNSLNLIASSSAHHSSLSDDTSQAVGGCVVAVSDTLVKARGNTV